MTQRNQHGVANSCDQYRTIKGVRWNQWDSCLTDSSIKRYRDAGVRCRYISNELYVHPADVWIASLVYDSIEVKQE